MKSKKEEVAIEVMSVATTSLEFCLLGTTPLLMNRLHGVTKQELIYPRGAKNKAERAATPKHNPLQEFRDSVYRTLDPQSPTRLIMPGGAFKRAIADVAVDIPGAFKAQIGRLTSVLEVNVNVYGTPLVHHGVVRQAGINKTPDVRFRACLPEWATRVTVQYVTLLAQRDVQNLFAAAGIIMGVGDGRPQKGALNYGQFSLVSEDDEAWNRIVSTQAAAAQDEALANPNFIDEETEELVRWYEAEVIRRAAQPETKKTPRKAKKAKAPSLPPLTNGGTVEEAIQ